MYKKPSWWVDNLLCPNTVLFNLCDALVRMRKQCGANDKHDADEKALLCCCKRIFLNLFFILSPYWFFCKTWYRAQRKVGRHCAYILIVWASQQRNVLEVTGSYYETFYLLVPLLCHDGNKICATASQSWADINCFVFVAFAQDQRSYSICVLGHELSVLSSCWHRHHCSQYLRKIGRPLFRTRCDVVEMQSLVHRLCKGSAFEMALLVRIWNGVVGPHLKWRCWSAFEMALLRS